VEHECLFCGKKFSGYSKKRKYCSTACVNKSRARPFEERLMASFCKVCEKKILANKSSNRQFCSRSCANKERIWSEASKKKSSLSHIGKKHGAMKEETKYKLRIAKLGKPSKLKGIPKSRESVIKQSISMKKYCDEHPRKHSAETKFWQYEFDLESVRAKLVEVGVDSV
jgi:hypothetical protein